jgi:hypothetical protein
VRLPALGRRQPRERRAGHVLPALKDLIA